MKELLMKLRKERMELTSKINNLVKFRGTDEWNKLTATHKQLLDIQLEAMKTYSEALTGRCIEIQERMAEQETASKPKDKDDEPVKVFIISLGDTKEDE